MSGNLVNYNQRINAKALSIALAIFEVPPEDRFGIDHTDRVYYAIDRADFGSDERKADLYARLADTLHDDMRLDQAEAVIAECMHATNKVYMQ